MQSLNIKSSSGNREGYSVYHVTCQVISCILETATALRAAGSQLDLSIDNRDVTLRLYYL